MSLVSLNKKMGHRAITNCAWSLGERGTDGALCQLLNSKHSS